MVRAPRPLILLSCFVMFSSLNLLSQEDSGWRISPEKINIRMGDDRALQLLDDSAQELHGAIWSVDDPETASVEEIHGRAVLHSKKVGTVRVSAALNGEMRFRDIKIWSALRSIPPGTTNWGTHPIGREIGDIPAVPTGDGPTMFSLEEDSSGNTYLRGVENDGIQAWTWLLPEKIHDVELVCGDWLGGALISANHADSYTLYAVGKDGKLRWRRTLAGIRKGIAYNLEHLIHVLSESPDGTVSRIDGVDEETGAQRFELTLPASRETQANVHREGTRILCTSKSASSPLRTVSSRLIVSMDGLAYIAFTKYQWTLGTAKCAAGSLIEARDVTFTRDEKLLLWQIHPDGTYRSTVVEESKSERPLSDPVSAASPTGAIIPDGLNGVLLPVRWSHDAIVEDVHGSPDEFVYRIDQDGEVAYKFPLPKHDGALHDDMVLGEEERGFATRGGTLIAFNARSGKEIWRWNSGAGEISVFAALANGGCVVKTATGLVEVTNGLKAKEIFQGDAIMGWQGQMFRKHAPH